MKCVRDGLGRSQARWQRREGDEVLVFLDRGHNLLQIQWRNVRLLS